jgi:hypothetical protein
VLRLWLALAKARRGIGPLGIAVGPDARKVNGVVKAAPWLIAYIAPNSFASAPSSTTRTSGKCSPTRPPLPRRQRDRPHPGVSEPERRSTTSTRRRAPPSIADNLSREGGGRRLRLRGFRSIPTQFRQRPPPSHPTFVPIGPPIAARPKRSCATDPLESRAHSSN